MFKVHAPKIFLTLLVLCVAASMLQAQNPPASPLTSDHASIAVTYQKPSTAGATVNVKFTAASSTTFVIDPSTVPFWLTVGAIGGPATAVGVTVTFDPNANAASLNAGGYNGAVHVKVSGFADLVIPVSLTVSDPASNLTVIDNGGIDASLGETINWTYGSAYPTLPLTMVSSDAPIGFTITVTGNPANAPANWITFTHTSGVAYTYGSLITASFLSDILYNAAVGAILNGQITVTPSNGKPAINIPITINVNEPAATITRIFPSQTPMQALPGTALKVVVTGSGFGTTGGYSGQPTTVSIAYGAVVATDITTIAGGGFSVANPNTLIITIPVQDGTPADILSAAQNVTISIKNGNIGSTVTATLTVTTNPIIYTVADSASIVEATPPANPTVAPYELISIFGDNFGLTGTNVVNATLDPYKRYPITLPANAHTIGVAFWNAAGSTKLADAYLLFASKTQINALVPSSVVAGQTYRIVVTYNALASAATPASGYAVDAVAQNPGVFTTTSSGTGQGAILLSDFSLNDNNTHKAPAGSTVMIYVTGLGAPNSTASNAAPAAKAAFPTTCVAATGNNSYMSTVNALAGSPGWTTVDGAVIQSSLLKTNLFPPCMATANAVTVTIGGKAAKVTYAGWVADSVAGLYQINATLAATTPSGTQSVAVTVRHREHAGRCNYGC